MISKVKTPEWAHFLPQPGGSKNEKKRQKITSTSRRARRKNAENCLINSPTCHMDPLISTIKMFSSSHRLLPPRRSSSLCRSIHRNNGRRLFLYNKSKMPFLTVWNDDLFEKLNTSCPSAHHLFARKKFVWYFFALWCGCRWFNQDSRARVAVDDEEPEKNSMSKRVPTPTKANETEVVFSAPHEIISRKWFKQCD